MSEMLQAPKTPGSDVDIAIDVAGVRKTYDRGVIVALDGVTFSVRSGELVAVTRR